MIVKVPSEIHPAYNEIVFIDDSSETLTATGASPSRTLTAEYTRVIEDFDRPPYRGYRFDVQSLVSKLFHNNRIAINLDTVGIPQWAFEDFNLKAMYTVGGNGYVALNAVKQFARGLDIYRESQSPVLTNLRHKDNTYYCKKYKGFPVGVTLVETEKYFVPPQVTLSVDSYSAGSRGGTFTVDVTANKPWVVDNPSDWVHFSQTSGPAGTTIVTITIDLAPTDAARSSEFMFRADTATASLYISQAGFYFSVSDTLGLTVGPEGSSNFITVESSEPWQCVKRNGSDWVTVTPDSGGTDDPSITNTRTTVVIAQNTSGLRSELLQWSPVARPDTRRNTPITQRPYVTGLPLDISITSTNYGDNEPGDPTYSGNISDIRANPSSGVGISLSGRPGWGWDNSFGTIEPYQSFETDMQISLDRNDIVSLQLIAVSFTRTAGTDNRILRITYQILDTLNVSQLLPNDPGYVDLLPNGSGNFYGNPIITLKNPLDPGALRIGLDFSFIFG